MASDGRSIYSREELGVGDASVASSSHTDGLSHQEVPILEYIRRPIPYPAPYPHLLQILNEISVYRSMDYKTDTWQADIPQFVSYSFLRVHFHDWDEECRSLSSDWQTSWHGALSPYIIKIVARNGFYPTQITGAGGTMVGLLDFFLLRSTWGARSSF